MQKYLKRFIVATAMVGVAMAYAAPPAEAAFMLQISNGGPVTTCVDNAACDLAPLTSGLILWSGSLGAWIISIDVGESKPLLGNPDTAEMDLTWNAIAGAGATPLTMTLTDDGFTQGLNRPGTMRFQFNGNQPANSTTEGVATKDTTDCHNLSGGGPCVIDTGSLTTLGFGGTIPLTLDHTALTAAYPMSIQVTLAGGPGTRSGDSNLQNTAVPEPGSMMLLGTGLIGLARSARRRFGKVS